MPSKTTGTVNKSKIRAEDETAGPYAVSIEAFSASATLFMSWLAKTCLLTTQHTMNTLPSSKTTRTIATVVVVHLLFIQLFGHKEYMHLNNDMTRKVDATSKRMNHTLEDFARDSCDCSPCRSRGYDVLFNTEAETGSHGVDVVLMLCAREPSDNMHTDASDKDVFDKFPIPVSPGIIPGGAETWMVLVIPRHHSYTDTETLQRGTSIESSSTIVASSRSTKQAPRSERSHKGQRYAWFNL